MLIYTKDRAFKAFHKCKDYFAYQRIKLLHYEATLLQQRIKDLPTLEHTFPERISSYYGVTIKPQTNKYSVYSENFWIEKIFFEETFGVDFFSSCEDRSWDLYVNGFVEDYKGEEKLRNEDVNIFFRGDSKENPTIAMRDEKGKELFSAEIKDFLAIVAHTKAFWSLNRDFIMLTQAFAI